MPCNALKRLAPGPQARITEALKRIWVLQPLHYDKTVIILSASFHSLFTWACYDTATRP